MFREWYGKRPQQTDVPPYEIGTLREKVNRLRTISVMLRLDSWMDFRLAEKLLRMVGVFPVDLFWNIKESLLEIRENQEDGGRWTVVPLLDHENKQLFYLRSKTHSLHSRWDDVAPGADTLRLLRRSFSNDVPVPYDYFTKNLLRSATDNFLSDPTTIIHLCVTEFRNFIISFVIENMVSNASFECAHRFCHKRITYSRTFPVSLPVPMEHYLCRECLVNILLCPELRRNTINNSSLPKLTPPLQVQFSLC